MQFKFVGNPHDPRDGKVSIVAFGIMFPLNVAVNVDDARIIKKLMGNDHFAAVDGGVTYHQLPGKLIAAPSIIETPSGFVSVAPAPVLEPEPEVKPSDLRKDELVEAAASYSVAIDKRWSAQRIASTIEAVLASRDAETQEVPVEVEQSQQDEVLL